MNRVAPSASLQPAASATAIAPPSVPSNAAWIFAQGVAGPSWHTTGPGGSGAERQIGRRVAAFAGSLACSLRQGSSVSAATSARLSIRSASAASCVPASRRAAKADGALPAERSASACTSPPEVDPGSTSL